MAGKSNIAWCDSSFGGWIGCEKISQGCRNCYAERMMTPKTRWKNTWGTPDKSLRIKTSEQNWRKPYIWNDNGYMACPSCGWRGEVRETAITDFLSCPSCGEKVEATRRRVFCEPMGDIFENNPKVVTLRKSLLLLMQNTLNLDWLVLTKRAELINQLGSETVGEPFVVWLKRNPHIMVGATVENQDAVSRIAYLNSLGTRYFLSIEPMLEHIDLILDSQILNNKPSWVIVGGESGPGRRPFSWDWARSIRDQCARFEIPFFMKQGSAASQKSMPEIPSDLMIREFPKNEK